MRIRHAQTPIAGSGSAALHRTAPVSSALTGSLLVSGLFALTVAAPAAQGAQSPEVQFARPAQPSSARTAPARPAGTGGETFLRELQSRGFRTLPGATPEDLEAIAASVVVAAEAEVLESAMDFPASADRVAIEHAEEVPEARILQIAEQVGLVVTEVELAPRPGWTILRVAPLAHGADRCDARLAAMTQYAEVRVATPVLEQGEDWAVPMAKVIFEMAEGTDTSAADVLAQIGSLALVEEEFAQMERTCLASVASRDGLEIVSLAAALAAHPDVAWAEPDMLMSAQALHIPNDPGFASQWGFLNTGQYGGTPGVDMDVDLAWNVTQGASSVRVLILDTGTDGGHPDLNEAARMDFTGTNLNFCDNHGTPVGGCVSAIINNNMGVAGMSPGSPILSARIFVSYTNCSGGGTVVPSQVASALTWGLNQGARITNTSLSLIPSTTISARFNSTRNSGMCHYAAGGNNSAVGSVYPGSLNSVHEVAALNPQGSRAWFSNRSSDMLYAAGEDIYTTDRVSGGYSAGNYTTIEGTSFAAPYVAGVAALILSVYPQATPAEVEDILRLTATDLGASGRDSTYGWGFVNAKRAVDEAVRRATQCQVSQYFHPSTVGLGSGGQFHISAPNPLVNCGTTVNATLSGVPANQTAWMVLADQLQPTPNPALGGAYFVDPTPITSIQVQTDAQGRFCLPNLPNCGTTPLFVQMLWTRPGQSTLGVSEVVWLDFGQLPKYEVGPNKMFGRIQHAVWAASLHSSATNSPVVELSTGTYDEPLYVRGSMVIREAPGQTAVLHSTGSVAQIFEVQNFTDTSITVHWQGIDIVADGSIGASPMRVSADRKGDTTLYMSDMSLTDAPTVSAPTNRPFLDVYDSADSSEAYVTFTDVDIQTDDFAYESMFRVRDRSKITVTFSGSPTHTPAGSGRTLVTSANHVGDVWSGDGTTPGLYLRGSDIQHLSTQGEAFLSDGGTVWLEGVKLVAPAQTKGFGRYLKPNGNITAYQSRLEAKQGAQGPLFDLSSGSDLQLSLLNSALVYDAAATPGGAVVRAPLGVSLFVGQSTISSTTASSDACFIDGNATAANSTSVIGDLAGSITGSIFELPGSHRGVVRGNFGAVTLEHGVENVRFCPTGFPRESDQLPGFVHELDPALAADGFHLTAASTTLPRTEVISSFDIDGELRRGFGIQSSTFGCDHTLPTLQAGLQVGAGYAFPTIQSAIQAATPGQTIIVHGGNYNEKIQWNKPVNIVEAWGETATLNVTTSAGGSYLIQQSGWPANSEAVWDGIDVTAAGTGNNDVVLVQGAPGIDVCTVRFRNCNFNDGPSSFAGVSYFRVEGPATFLAIENARIEPLEHSFSQGFEVRDSSYVSVNKSYVSFRATETADISGGGQVAFNETEIVDRGSTIFQVDGNQSSGSLNRSIVRTRTGRGTGAVGVLLGGACNIGVNRSIVDATNGTAATPFWFTQVNTGAVYMSDSALLFHSGRTQGRGIIDARLGGHVTMTHCTVQNVEDLPQFRQYANVIKGPAQANATLTGLFQGNVFDIEGSTEGAIENVGHLSQGQVQVVGSQNVVFVGSGSGLWDRLTGTIFPYDPHLAGDGVHLTNDSRASLPRTNASSSFRDIEHDARPAPGAFARNFGCDEILP